MGQAVPTMLPSATSSSYLFYILWSSYFYLVSFKYDKMWWKIRNPETPNVTLSACWAQVAPGELLFNIEAGNQWQDTWASHSSGFFISAVGQLWAMGLPLLHQRCYCFSIGHRFTLKMMCPLSSVTLNYNSESVEATWVPAVIANMIMIVSATWSSSYVTPLFWITTWCNTVLSLQVVGWHPVLYLLQVVG
jgi:hypothetical protein